MCNKHNYKDCGIYIYSIIIDIIFYKDIIIDIIFIQLVKAKRILLIQKRKMHFFFEMERLYLYICSTCITRFNVLCYVQILKYRRRNTGLG